MITTTTETLLLDSTTTEYDYDIIECYFGLDEWIGWEDEHAEVKESEIVSLKIVSLVIYSLVLVLGVLGNGVVIWVTGFKMKKTINSVWYLNLAVADFLFTALLPLRITERALDGHWLFGSFMCKLNGAVLFLNMYACIYSLMVISVDRCVCVVWPGWAQNHRSIRKASCVCLSVWVLALSLSSPYFIFKDTRELYITHQPYYITTCRYNFRGTHDSTPAMILALPRFLMGFVVPFAVIISCYSVIIYRLRSNPSLASQSGRPFKIIAAVIATFFLCWAPYHILELSRLIMSAGDSETLEHVSIIVFSLAYINSCLNPMLYVFMGQDFKNEVRSSVLKVLEKAFTEELPPETNSQEISLSEAQV